MRPEERPERGQRVTRDLDVEQEKSKSVILLSGVWPSPIGSKLYACAILWTAVESGRKAASAVRKLCQRHALSWRLMIVG
jgi:hypothetical protein